MNPDLGRYDVMGYQRQAAQSIHKQAAEVEARLKAEPGRANAPAICRCSHSLLLAGCTCAGYVPYKQRERGF
jgi:hypothetical protein